MLLKDEVGMLRRVPLFAGVEPAKLKLLAFTSDRVSYNAGQTLFHQGDEGDAAYVDAVGQRRHHGGVRMAARSRWPSWSRTPSSARSPSCATCRARRPCKATAPLEALRIRKDHFLRLLREFPEMTIEIVRVLADRLSHTTAELTAARSGNRH